MQLARQPSRESDAPPRTSSAPQAATVQDGPVVTSPARELQAALNKAFDDGLGHALVSPEPHVTALPGWAKILVLTGMTALSWVAVLGLAKLVASD
jgi:hypothetical protein